MFKFSCRRIVLISALFAVACVTRATDGRIPISQDQLPLTINASGHYYLTQDLLLTTPGMAAAAATSGKRSMRAPPCAITVTVLPVLPNCVVGMSPAFTLVGFACAPVPLTPAKAVPTNVLRFMAASLSRRSDLVQTYHANLPLSNLACW